jgi:hypothetical protein
VHLFTIPEESSALSLAINQAMQDHTLKISNDAYHIRGIVSNGDDQTIVHGNELAALTPKTLKDVGSNLYNDFINPANMGSKYYANLPVAILSVFGEMSEYAADNIVYAVSKLPGGQYVLESIGGIVGSGLDAAYSTVSKGAKLVLNEEQINSLVQHYQELPHGCKVLGPA